ncbi:MAG: acyl transferase [Bacteroidota bacterium]
MAFSDSFKTQIHSITPSTFESAALELFHYQWAENTIYREFCNSLYKNPANTRKLHEIPFLPISFFKNQRVTSGSWSPQLLFKSSGTASTRRSIHYVKDLDFYLKNTRRCFEYFYGTLSRFSIKALLPSYQEQGESSLIAMVDYFMQKAPQGSGYFLRNHEALKDELLAPSETQPLLLGVSFALLDMVEGGNISIGGSIVMETGGMKGRRKEITRKELHEQLQSGFGVASIHSEYGMSELMSQAYAKSQGILQFPPWAGVLIRDVNDPFSYVEAPRTGGVNVIDLANVDTCGFIETMDLGRKNDENRFEILGRFDNSDIRGCNLLV